MPITFVDKYLGLTQAEVRRLFDYEPGTGDLIRKIRTSNRVKVGGTAGTRALTKEGYRRILVNIGPKKYRVSRIAWLWMTGEWPEHEIDHKDGDGWNNRWYNLRPATHGQNQKNMVTRKTNTTGTPGVTWDSGRNKFAARIKVDCKTIHLGRFININDAIVARKAAEQKYFGEFIRG